MKEIWKPVKLDGIQERYAVSNYGKVFDFKQNKYLTLHNNGNGYRIYGLRRDGNPNGAMRYAHRLVGMHFLDNPNNLPQVGHIDHDKDNNHHSNLYWTTQKQNTRDGIEAGRINAKKRPNTKQLTKEQICSIALLHSQGYGVAEIGKKIGSPRTTISSVINGRSNWELFKFTLDEINSK